jgi:hypothetical protein
MTVHFDKYIAVVLLALVAATPSAVAFAQQSKPNSLYPPISWQILPGEDIAETARLVYPKDPVARDSLIRAIIRINPDHFPQGTNRLLAAGTVIQFPDLRTVGAYAKRTVSRQQKQNRVHQETRNRLQQTPADNIAAQLKNNSAVTQLIAQLEKTAIAEAQELTELSVHIAALESLLHKLRSISLMGAATGKKSFDGVPSASTENSASPPVPTLQQHTTQPGSQAPVLDEVPELPIEVSVFADTVFLVGILLTLLIALLILRSYRSIKQRFARRNIFSGDTGEESDRHEALLLQREEAAAASSGQLSESTGRIMDEVSSLIEQNNSAAAIELLQKQLATDQRDIQGWLQLFELLYKAGNKRDFKKNARRFKRMKKFPDIWMQIQELGSRLEPNESLYFNEQKRKEKFFPESTDSVH